MKLNQRHFYCEYLISIVQISQSLCFFSTKFSNLVLFNIQIQIFLLGAWFGIFIFKRFQEGNRLISFIYLFAEMFIILSLLIPNIAFEWNSCIFSIMYVLSQYFFPSYHFPIPTGPFYVGYKILNIASATNVSVFYPTKEKTVDSPWLDASDFFEKMHEICKLLEKPAISLNILKWSNSFLLNIKLGVQTHAKLHIEGKNKKYETIVFIHDLISHRNAYAIFFRELASMGYIIFTIGISEEIYMENEARYKRQKQLETRFHKVENLLDLISNPWNFQKIFPEIKEEYSLDFDIDHLHIMGHSFGAATALYTACNDERITGKCIMLDPWFYPVPNDLEFTELANPFLCIKSENFNDFMPKWRNDSIMYDIFLNNKEIIKDCSVCVIKNTGHHTATDFSVLTPRENVLMGLIRDINSLDEHYLSHRNLIVEYLQYTNQKQE